LHRLRRKPRHLASPRRHGHHALAEAPRLAETGAVDSSELPLHLDQETLVRVRQSFEARPARPVLEVLADAAGHRIVLLGDPGAGKSTLARYLAVVLALRNDSLPPGLTGLLPVLIELRSYAEVRRHCKNFLDYLDDQHRNSDERLGLPHDVLERLLNASGRTLVIFDGLDELFDPKARESVSRQITGFAGRYPGARILVTSRHVGYQRSAFDSAKFHHHLLQDLDRDQISAFAKHWFRISCSGNPAGAARLEHRLLDAVDGSPAVRELAGNPLLLTILAIIGRRHELPRDRLTVYQHAVTVLVEHWDFQKHIDRVAPDLPPLDRRDKLDLLRLIARRMQEAPAGLAGNHIAGPDLLEMFQLYLAESHGLPPGRARVAARAMLEQFRQRSFVLSRFGGEVYGFVHRAFLEYLAAADIDERFSNRELSEEDLIEGVFGRRWQDPAWHEVLLLLTGMREPYGGRIVDRLLRADPLWYLRRGALPQHIFLAARCLGEVRRPNALGHRNIMVVRALIDVLDVLENRIWDNSLATAIRRQVLPVMARMDARWSARETYLAWYRVRSLMTGRRRSPDTNPDHVATSLANALDHAGSLRPWMSLVSVIGGDATVRQAAVDSVATRWPDHPDTVPLLDLCATGDMSWAVRCTATAGLATTSPDRPETRRFLCLQAAADGDAYVRQVAIDAIATGWPDRAEHFALIAGFATDDDSAETRRAAINASVLGWPNHIGTFALLADRAVDDPDDEVRQAAVEALILGWLDHPGTLPLLLDLAYTDDSQFVRHAAIEGIVTGRRESPETPALLHDRAIGDSEGFVRLTACIALRDGWPEHPGTLRCYATWLSATPWTTCATR
jgi:hypothetical protein